MDSKRAESDDVSNGAASRPTVPRFDLRRVGGLVYGVVAYLAFLIVILYAIGFVGDFVVPKTIDSGADAPFAAALVIDVALLGVFALQHSGMARPAFKRWWTSMFPSRSNGVPTYSCRVSSSDCCSGSGDRYRDSSGASRSPRFGPSSTGSTDSGG